MTHDKQVPMTRTQILFPPEVLAKIDDWRFQHRAESRGEAVRMLVEMALNQHTESNNG